MTLRKQKKKRARPNLHAQPPQPLDRAIVRSGRTGVAARLVELHRCKVWWNTSENKRRREHDRTYMHNHHNHWTVRLYGVAGLELQHDLWYWDVHAYSDM